MTKKCWSLAALALLVACSEPPSQPAEKPPAATTPSAPESPRITQFYASPPNPIKGEKTLICYGTQNATSVRVEPPIGDVWPSPNRCVAYVPTSAVTLKLTAEGNGGSATATVSLAIGKPKVEILDVSFNTITPKEGDSISVCFRAKNAVSVKIEPGTWLEPHTASIGCVSDRPRKETTYTVTAAGADGESDTKQITWHMR